MSSAVTTSTAIANATTPTRAGCAVWVSPATRARRRRPRPGLPVRLAAAPSALIGVLPTSAGQPDPRSTCGHPLVGRHRRGVGRGVVREVADLVTLDVQVTDPWR